jgi:hypothetical protein
MATATISFNVDNTVPLGEKNQKTVRYYGTVSFSAAADVYLTGGMAPVSGGALLNMGPYADRTPLRVDVFSQNGSSFQYKWDQATGKLKVYSGAAAADGVTAAPELTNNTALNATTPAISTDVVGFEAVFPAR